ncbi:hypothetical protein QW060_20425 [Myroides ceti]|uniref:Uncharacterized protein n=1 Tax=Paenimyroides ceti TaxID=395087 RepID=A0ABT8CYS7_9FLAO|nr:hypothetical protein [Paenimyroides ceti]MDN3709379.1 hypothetical protein [Paenimyroides ceti]
MGYGKHIEKALIEKGHDITFINCIEINYKYTSFWIVFITFYAKQLVVKT